MYSVIVPEVVLVLGRVAGRREGVAAKSERNSSDFKPNQPLMKHRALFLPQSLNYSPKEEVMYG